MEKAREMAPNSSSVGLTTSNHQTPPSGPSWKRSRKLSPGNTRSPRSAACTVVWDSDEKKPNRVGSLIFGRFSTSSFSSKTFGSASSESSGARYVSAESAESDFLISSTSRTFSPGRRSQNTRGRLLWELMLCLRRLAVALTFWLRATNSSSSS